MDGLLQGRATDHLCDIAQGTEHDHIQGEGIACKLIPVPRKISSDCGVCIRVLQADVEAASQAIAAAQVEIEGIYEI